MRLRHNSQRDLKWVRSRKKLLRDLKSEVKKRVGPLPADLERKASALSLKRLGPYSVRSKAQLLSRIQKVEVVLSGDFHAHGSSQRMHLKLIREVAKFSKWTLALECFAPSSNRLLQQFLGGKISLEQLRERSRFDRRWGFSFANYSPLLEIAREMGLNLVGVGLDAAASARLDLKAQDSELAHRLTETQSRFECPVFCVVGELHLPGLARRLSHFTTAELYSQSEALYFDLALQGREGDVEVVQFQKSPRRSAFRFGLICSPPWVPWQSYLIHLDQKEEQESESEFDLTDAVRNQGYWLIGELELEKSFRDCENRLVKIENAEQFARAARLSHAAFKKTEPRIRRLIDQHRSFWIPELGIGCLAETSVNHISALSMEWLHSVLSGRTVFIGDDPNSFFAQTWVYAVSFFGSKLVNHNRRSPSFIDLQDELKNVSHRNVRTQALELVLRLRLIERSGRATDRLGYGPEKLIQMMTSNSTEGANVRETAALILGRMLGDRFYQLQRKGGLSASEIHHIVQSRILRKDFVQVYTEWVRRIDRRLQQRGLRREAIPKSERL